MSGIEIKINGRSYILSGSEPEPHLREVADMVRNKIEDLRKERPAMSMQTAAFLAAFDFASLAVKGKRRGNAYRKAVLDKAHELLRRVETELTPNPDAH